MPLLCSQKSLPCAHTYGEEYYDVERQVRFGGSTHMHLLNQGLVWWAVAEQNWITCRSSSVKANLAKAAEFQHTSEKGSSSDLAKQACQPGSSASAEQPAGSADMAKQAPDETPGMGRRLRSADSLRRWDRASDGEEAAPSLRAAISDSIVSHTGLLRSSSQ